MKWIIVVAVLMTCMVLGHCRLCEKAEDCNDGECCVALTINQIRGKGICRRFGRLGSTCNLEGITLESYGGKYLSKCPCRSEYSCEPSPRYTRIYRDGTRNRLLADISQRCRRPSTVTNKVTTSSKTPDVSIDGKTVSVTSSSSIDGKTVSVTSSSSIDGKTVSVTSSSSIDGSSTGISSSDDSSTGISSSDGSSTGISNSDGSSTGISSSDGSITEISSTESSNTVTASTG